MPGRKVTDFALNYGYESYDQYFFGSEKQAASNTIQSLSLFIEHGISNRASVVFTVPYIWIDSENEGIQDAILAIKYRNQRKTYDNGNLNFITSIGLSVPASAYDAETDNPIGNRNFTFQGRFLMQYNFNYGFFIHLQSGIDFQFAPVSRSALPLLFRTGFGAKYFYVDGWIEYFTTFNAGADTQLTGGSGSQWWRLGLTGYAPIYKGLGAFVGWAYIPTGKNIGQSHRLNTGIVYKLKGRSKKE
ncbi:MAG: transporter [Bacteroidota bacterium]